ncbi:MAG TPA: hydroxymethylglutaryl-CoA lyase [Thermoanaerobaculia bacterium]|jgi:isopropylmalate/homocitrate/citramalate synthase|nr:hydroxymethylglutaryl-CoA lyase [Thermoanaerobaculia bacterium]HPA50737.1 hydroxymethylglutaryl-CoA lyase [Thermoanaerobaculia bacterium]HQN08798.1 hydroxymethylglutaryl-CoA lyase [Thermoanaerobaculia bacterium]HQP86072.1 hydroxymethylglutaryl-CoA lyase [Thermoanaerobaculia bacterium]
MTGAGRVTVVEVGPRDGLQNERGFVPTDVKVAFVEALADAGLPVVETTAFVSPRAIPQLADSAEVFARVRKRPGTRYPVLVPNERGMGRALAAGAREIALFTAATDTFNLRNVNATVEESFARFAPVLDRARGEGLRVRGYVSTAFGCPYEGRVDAAKAAVVAARLFAAGCQEVSLGDTIGVAVPSQVTDVLGKVREAGVPIERIALHMHDTRGTALANVVEGLREGVRVFDSSAGGLGGCPYAPGAAGNLATEDLVYLLHAMGWETGIDLEKVSAASEALAAAVGRMPVSRVFAAMRAASERASKTASR